MNTTADGGGIRPNGDSTADATDELLARTRVEDAAQRRRRERWRAARRVEETTLTGALLGAGPAPVTLHLDGRVTVSGVVVRVGHDVVELDSPGASVAVQLDSILAVETGGSLTGDPSDRVPVTLVEVLEAAVHDGTQLSVTLRSGTVLRGEVIGVGESLVLTVDVRDRHVVVPLERIALVARAHR